jgi:arabinan endo-1,5-alpha-L-arabinosidase
VNAKSFRVLVLASLLSTALPACGSSGDDPTQSSEDDDADAQDDDTEQQEAPAGRDKSDARVDKPPADAGARVDAGDDALDATSPSSRDARSEVVDGRTLETDARASDGASPAEPSVPDASSNADGGPGPSDGGSMPNENCSAREPAKAALALRGNLGAHDPVVIESEGTYHVFVTGRGIPTKRSTDRLNWQAGASVFSRNPDWVAERVPGATDLWAPDISLFGGAYHLYYSVSTFGSNRSCIGHATRTSLTSGSWQDRGPVICSNGGSERHDWNAIDPNIVLDESGTPWMSFGSFWSGIKLIKLNAEGARADDRVLAIAGRPPNGGAIEAPFIVRRCGMYYLFVSFDKCCSGAQSTYNVRVGRSDKVTGPYVDANGMALTSGGGTEILRGDSRWKGPGHNAILMTASGAFNVYHAYAASDGHSELRIAELGWNAQGWPISGGP